MTATSNAGTATAPLLRTELPGPLAREVLARDEAVTSRSLPRAYPLVPLRGRGSVIEDVDGNLFLDFNAGIAVNSTGHAHPRVVEAVQRQSAELLHYSASDFYLPIYSEMCRALADTAPIDGPARVFLTNSGAEAVEGALKLARHATGRQYAISFYGSFHGRSYGAVSLTASKSKYHKGFGPLLPGILHAPYGSDATFEHLEDVLFRHVVSPDEVAAIFVEPVQGEGGYIVPPEGWLARLRELCDRHGILLVADEVQSGVGRTGRMWAIEHTGVRPDVLLSAKGLASGLPLGAFVARADLMETWPAGAHGSTYGGSPVPCAAGLATLEVIESEGLLANATAVGERLTAGLREFQARWPEAIVDVRGVGLMIGVELATAELAEAVQQAAFERGLLVLECGESSIRVSPPLVITEAEADTGLRVLGEALAAVAG
ncbi:MULTISPECIES: aminotransferase class III-fold pyridoxal phosphate-dependent enzyme [Actinosynnema]|uniref:aminotransferase class III-fold pyridoxal phosphate-dependent enzyme n=1 Tax=Actinosynnema TaxID=40566 RepID=UPI0020A2E7C8|nr:aminotransferase class III-fold pyridoxal phosphate-dependent enzyme [Actinosynnema pretiosum]MCP2098541.1 4-aminobutyrate aminotransferase [Actinosynnema pretiosum]